MKKLPVLLVVILATTPVARAKLYTRVCRADGVTPLELADPNTPFVYRDVMVGTKLAIILSSDAGGYWEGGLFIAGSDRDSGVLSGKDFNDTTIDWVGSRFNAVGKDARVINFEDYIRSGFDLYGSRYAVAGDWFVIYYDAIGIGNCRVGLYDYSVSIDDPICSLLFSHVPSRDFNRDNIVNFVDFAMFASHWQEMNCDNPNWCEGTDLDSSGGVDSTDLILFADYWLESTE